MSAFSPGERVPSTRVTHVGDTVAAAAALREVGLVPDGFWYDPGRNLTHDTTFATVDCTTPEGGIAHVEVNFVDGQYAGNRVVL